MSLMDHVRGFLSPSAPMEMSSAGYKDLSEIIDKFRNDRADAMAETIHRAGTLGAEVSILKQDVRKYKCYVRDLERVILAAGLPLPRAPDEE